MLRPYNLSRAPTSTSPRTSKRSTMAGSFRRSSSYAVTPCAVPRSSSPMATTAFAPATSWTRTPTSPVGWWTDRRRRTELEADRAYLHPDALCRAARCREGVRQGGIVRRSHDPPVRATACTWTVAHGAGDEAVRAGDCLHTGRWWRRRSLQLRCPFRAGWQERRRPAH